MAFSNHFETMTFHQRFSCSSMISKYPISPLVKCTLGLRTMFSNICYNRDNKETREDLNIRHEVHDDSDGFLVFPSKAERRHSSLLFGGRYKFIKLIGQGTFAQIVEAEDQFSSPLCHPRRVAVKIIRSGLTPLGMQESCLHFALAREECFGCVNIVNPIAGFMFHEHHCLVMELFPSSLKDLIQCSSPPSISVMQLRKLSWQLCTALSFLKTKDIIHADIRPENILISSIANSCQEMQFFSSRLKIKLADFGNSFFSQDCFVYEDTFDVQTLMYRSPEVLFGLPFDSQIGLFQFFVFFQ